MLVSVIAAFLGTVVISVYAGPIAVNLKRFVTIPIVASDVAKPYEFGYQSVDELGTSQHRQEVSNGKGVLGSYGYIDPPGVYRIVKYVADDDGYRAVVTSNEPGMGTSSSANAVYFVQPPPAAALLWQDPNYAATKE